MESIAKYRSIDVGRTINAEKALKRKDIGLDCIIRHPAGENRAKLRLEVKEVVIKRNIRRVLCSAFPGKTAFMQRKRGKTSSAVSALARGKGQERGLAKGLLSAKRTVRDVFPW